MIISQTPYRISFFGGGTDYPVWYRKNGGQVLSTTIDKFIYISCRTLPPFFEHRLRLSYSKIELCNSLDELDHPSARETLRHMGLESGLELHYDGDLPGRCGMGSSSAFTVGLLNVLYAFKGEVVTAAKLSKDSIHIEQTMVGEQVGSQDQTSASYGGFNKIQFSRDGEIVVLPIAVDEDTLFRLNQCLMLFFTGVSRTAADVANTYVNNIENHAKQFRKMHKFVDQGVDILCGSGDLKDFGQLLHESWLEKRSLSEQVSSSYLDEIYDAARAVGAVGGKLLGAGGGGMMLLFVPLENQAEVKEKLTPLIHVPFQFESAGSQIIFHSEIMGGNG
jgi:D-glycero-alpha-D-manno-heptose-7-phosphate kinase